MLYSYRNQIATTRAGTHSAGSMSAHVDSHRLRYGRSRPVATAVGLDEFPSSVSTVPPGTFGIRQLLCDFESASHDGHDGFPEYCLCRCDTRSATDHPDQAKRLDQTKNMSSSPPSSPRSACGTVIDYKASLPSPPILIDRRRLQTLILVHYPRAVCTAKRL